MACTMQSSGVFQKLWRPALHLRLLLLAHPYHAVLLHVSDEQLDTFEILCKAHST